MDIQLRYSVLTGLLFGLVLTATSCFDTNTRWTEEQRQAFKNQCAQTTVVSDLIVQFRGFDNSEFDTVQVKVYKDSTLTDVFSLFVEPSLNPEAKTRIAKINRPLDLSSRYLFVLKGQQPYELANMKMVMWAQFTMNSEGYGCVMGDYTLDGVHFEHSANPTFRKRE